MQKVKKTWRIEFLNEVLAEQAKTVVEQQLPSVRITTTRNRVFVHSLDRHTTKVVHRICEEFGGFSVQV